MCRSCSKVAYCLELPSGGFDKIDAFDCDSSQTCLKATGTCTTLANPDCDISDYVFTCYQAGIFPDAVNCFQYHFCKYNGDTVESVSIKQTCEAGRYFDPLTKLCRFKSVDGLCPAPLINCTSVGETGVHPLNPALYYVCLRSSEKIYPQFFACPNALVYNTTSHSCVDRYQPPTAAGSDGKCTARGLFYDPSDCHNYFECGAVGGTPIARKCATRMYFNTTTSVCADFKCTDFE